MDRWPLDPSSGEMPTIRTIRPTDFISLISFFRHDARCEVTAPLWPDLRDGSDGRGSWGFLSRLITHGSSSQVWISFDGGGVSGLAVARPRAGKLAWDVEELLVTQDCRSAVVDLLEHLCAEAARRGARRVFLVTRVDGDLARTAGQAGFVQYTSETVYFSRSATVADREVPRRARPRLRQDATALFHLYNAAVPCSVRSAEAMTVDEWLSLDRAPRLWTPSLGGSQRHFVWEGGNGLVGWLQVSLGASSRHLELLVRPGERAALEEILVEALNLAGSRTPAYVTVREYQAELGSLLEGLGFRPVADHLVYSRQLTVRVPGRALVPARA